MSSSEESSGGSGGACTSQKKYKGVRCRKWGKWVSEIRVPGTQERLWLGSYSTPEGAAVAHDIAFYCLRRPLSAEKLNFPLMLPASVRDDMSPRSIQKAASDAGMAVDAQLVVKKAPPTENEASGSVRGQGSEMEFWGDVRQGFGTWDGREGRGEGQDLSISVEDYL